MSKEQYQKLQQELEEKNKLVIQYENEILEQKEQLEEIAKEKTEKETKVDKKTYSQNICMMVYDSIVNQVPTVNIPLLMQSYAKRHGETLSSVPQRTTVEQMARELGSIGDLQSAEQQCKPKILTLGFDATTQEGMHINNIHLTSVTDCNVIAIDQLPGGTADDYSEHICSSVDNLAETYASFHKDEFQHCRARITENISNTMTDRAVVNHASVQKVCCKWKKTLNELNCHLAC